MLQPQVCPGGMLGRANTSLKPDKNLLNSKFEQYKYTSGREHEITYTELLHPPHRSKPLDTEYSYQMTRVSCLFNHLIVSPGGTRYLYISYNASEGYCLMDAEQRKELITFQNSEKLLFNVSAVWSGKDEMFLCVGTDLYTLKVTPTSVEEVSKQKLVFHSLLLRSYIREGNLHVVLCYKTDDVFVHQILKLDEKGVFQVSASIKLSGIARFVSVKGDLLTLISEGKLLVPQEAHIIEEVIEVKSAEESAVVQEEEERNYSWTQTMEDVEVIVHLPSGILKTDLIIDIGLDSLEVRTKGGQELFKSKLFSKVEPKESTWQMSSDKKSVEVHLTKFQEAHNWAHLVDTPGYDKSGTLLSNISDLNEEDLQSMVRRMQTLSEYTSDTIDKSPLYTPNSDLEECDGLEGQQVLVSGFDLSSPGVKQKYLVELSPGNLLFSHSDRGFVVSHSVDACFYNAGDLDTAWKHCDTYHAFNMVQATKTQKKYMVTDPSRKYAAIVDISRHVYIYNSSCDNCYGKLLVMTLDNDDSEVLGVFPKKDSIVLLTNRHLISVNFVL